MRVSVQTVVVTALLVHGLGVGVGGWGLGVGVGGWGTVLHLDMFVKRNRLHTM